MEHFFSCLIFRSSKWSIFSGLVILVVVYVFLLRNPTNSAVEKVWVNKFLFSLTNHEKLLPLQGVSKKQEFWRFFHFFENPKNGGLVFF